MAKAISLKPEDLNLGGGGILADNNIRFDTVKFGTETYGGSGPSAVALMIEYTDIDTGLNADPGSGTKYQQSWSTGATHDCIPSKDGKQLIGTKAPRGSSNYGMFMEGLGNAISAEEFSANIDDDITILEGMECHMFQQLDTRPTAKKKKVTKPNGETVEYDPTIPMVDNVMVRPWNKKGGKPITAAPTEDGDLQIIASDLIKKILTDNPNGLSRSLLAVELFKTADSNINTDLVQLISHDVAFVSGIDGVTFENDVLKLG